MIGQYLMAALWLGVWALPVLFGLLLIYGTIRGYNQKRLLANTPTSNIQSVALGPTEVIGEARADSTCVTGPFSDEEGAYSFWSVERYKGDTAGKGIEGPDASGGSPWVTVDSGNTGEFYLDDGTGKLLIDPEDADFELDLEPTYEVVIEAEDDTPDEISDFVSESDDLDPLEPSSVGIIKRRRYKQWVVPEGERLYVFGNAESSESGSMVINSAKRGLFVISNKAEDEVRETMIEDSTATFLLGVFAVAVGFMGWVSFFFLSW